MKIKDAIQRFTWRFKESIKTRKPFALNKGDVDALNALIDFYDSQTSINESNNQLLVKMYIWHRIEMMKHYKEDIFGVQTQKRLVDTLCKPTEVFYKRFTSFLNETEYLAFIGEDNDLKRPSFILDENERNALADKMQQKIEDNPELFKSLTGDVWEVEDVRSNLIAEVNQLMLIANR